MQEGHGDFGAHALAEAQLADGAIDIARHIEHGGEAGEVFGKARGGDVVDVAVEIETVADGQVPPELAALSEDDADFGGIGNAMGVGFAAEDFDGAGRRDQNAGHHLDHGGFAGAIGAEIADGFAGLDGKRDAIDRADFGEFAGEKAADRAAETGLTFRLSEDFLDA